MGQDVEFDTPAGERVTGYLAPATAPGSPGVVVIQEWWGLNDQIRGVADRLAEAGYHALAPDLYRGRVTTAPDEANHLMTGLDWLGATEQDVCGAVRYLHARCARVGVMGFCLGGALSVIAAVKIPEVRSVVCYYGVPPEEQADPGDIRVPFLGHFATEDHWCTPALVEKLATGLADSATQHEICWYRAGHAFFNEAEPEVYDAPAAALSWQRTLEFLRRHLGSD